MTAGHHDAASEAITDEALTPERSAAYLECGFVPVFTEEVLRRELTGPLPQPPSLGLDYAHWDVGNAATFFAAYEAAFRERPGFPGGPHKEWVRGTGDDPAFRPQHSFLALHNGTAVGFITSADDEEDPERVGYIIQVGVDPHWRGRGIGGALIIRALAAWQGAGKAAVMLHVNSNNPGALRLYRRLGFAMIRRRGKFQRR